MKKTKYNIFKYLLILADILILCFIFGNSLLLAEESSEKSNIFVNFFVEKILQKDINLTDEHFLDTVTFFVRKLAHSFEYFVLTILSLNVLINFNVQNKIIILIMFIFIAASLDEIHQLFVPGRSFEYFDILMDMIGCFMFILICKVFDKKYLEI